MYYTLDTYFSYFQIRIYLLFFLNSFYPHKLSLLSVVQNCILYEVFQILIKLKVLINIIEGKVIMCSFINSEAPTHLDKDTFGI